MLQMPCQVAEDILPEIFLTLSVLFNYEKANPLHTYNYFKLFILHRRIDLCRSFSPALTLTDHLGDGLRKERCAPNGSSHLSFPHGESSPFGIFLIALCAFNSVRAMPETAPTLLPLLEGLLWSQGSKALAGKTVKALKTLGLLPRLHPLLRITNTFWQVSSRNKVKKIWAPSLSSAPSEDNPDPLDLCSCFTLLLRSVDSLRLFSVLLEPISQMKNPRPQEAKELNVSLRVTQVINDKVNTWTQLSLQVERPHRDRP